MNDVAARYEFRVFAPQLDATAQRMRAMSRCESSSESSETYLFDCGGVLANNVKIRRGRLELKQLIDRRHGLERWQPAGIWTFPVPLDTLRTLWPTGLVEAGPPESSALSLSELLGLAGRSRVLRRANVVKRRHRFTIGGCAAELDRLLVDGRPLESCAVESDDPQAALEAVDLLRLTGEVNRSYVQMLCDATHHSM